MTVAHEHTQMIFHEGRRMMHPGEALSEMYMTAAAMESEFLLRTAREALARLPIPATEADTVHRFAITARKRISRVMRHARPTLWSEEMYEVMQAASDAYPYEGQIWTTELLGDLPAYHAYETDRQAGQLLLAMQSPLPATAAADPIAAQALAALARGLDPDDTTIFSQMYYLDGDDVRGVIFLAAAGLLTPLDLPLGQLGKPIHFNARVQAGMFEFLRSPYVSKMRVRAPRADRRRLARAGEPEPPDINVVVLRRERLRDDATHEPSPVEWSYRWFVRGHWHRFWYKRADGQRELRPRWMAPYIKGPDGRPLKAPSPVVFAVKR